MKKIEKALNLLELYIRTFDRNNIDRYRKNDLKLNDARAELEEIRERLRVIEWVEHKDEHKASYECPSCGGRHAEHKDGCWLKAWIGGE